MDRSDREPADEGAVVRVSHAMERKLRDGPSRGRLRKSVVWILVDVSRLGVVAGLSLAVSLATIVVGVVGPVTVRQYLLEGTSVANAYIELQPGIITAITIVPGINQLVLSPEFGSPGRQRKRVEDPLSHRHDVEATAGVIASPTDPAGFLRTIVDAMREHAREFDQATGDSGSPELRETAAGLVDEVREDVRSVSDALTERRYDEFELVGAAIHLDATGYLHEVHELRRTSRSELDVEQEAALDDLEPALDQYTVAREYVRTGSIQTEFITFSRTMLYTGLPAVVVAHFAVRVIGPNAPPARPPAAGTTAGSRPAPSPSPCSPLS